MSKGESRKITVPPSLGYGSLTQGEIPGYSTLIFEVKLLSLAKLSPDVTSGDSIHENETPEEHAAHSDHEHESPEERGPRSRARRFGQRSSASTLRHDDP